MKTHCWPSARPNWIHYALLLSLSLSLFYYFISSHSSS
jgi:hypothetical protein